jgi:transcriptional/translational regulatory protein YebC/TACO1
MAGHSKWAQIKRKKAVVDAKRGAKFTKLIREITVAARASGGDPEGNPRLRTAIETAKAENMPQDNIERAIKKGTGELGGVTYEEATYEGYGPGGAAIMIEVTTDNLNRTVAEIRHIFSKRYVDAQACDEEAALEAALEAGAEDMVQEGDQYVITTDAATLHTVRAALVSVNVQPAQAEIAMMPTSTVQVGGEDAGRLLKLIDALEEQDDVSNVFSNFDIDAETLAAASE